MINFFSSLIERNFIIAVQQFKFDNMRSFITVICALFSFLSLSQNNSNIGISNNNSNTNTAVEEMPVIQDSVFYNSEMKEQRETQKNKGLSDKKSALKKEKTEEMSTRGYSTAPVPSSAGSVQTLSESDYSPEPTIESSSAYQNASYRFSTTKTDASIQRSQRTPSFDQQIQMDEAVDYFESNSPNSFEFHYFKYVSGNYNVSLINHLKEAEEIRPENTDVQVQMAAYNIIKRNNDSAIGYLDKLKAAGRLSENVLYYAEDILLSVPENGVLITHGFDDSYATWYKQNSSDVRKDVTIISLDFMQSDLYRALLKEDGFKIPESKIVDVDFLKAFCELNPTKKISISLTTPKEYFKPLQSNLYLTGLVFEYHTDTFDNYYRNDDLWNSTLKKYLVENAVDEKSKQLSSNYLPMLLQLRKVYVKTGNKAKLKDVDEASDKVSVQCKKYEQVQQMKNSY